MLEGSDYWQQGAVSKLRPAEIDNPRRGSPAAAMALAAGEVQVCVHYEYRVDIDPVRMYGSRAHVAGPAHGCYVLGRSEIACQRGACP